MCAMPNMAVFCSSFTSWFRGMLLMYFLNDFEMVPVTLVITGITLVFTFHKRCISIVRSLYFKILWAIVVVVVVVELCTYFIMTISCYCSAVWSIKYPYYGGLMCVLNMYFYFFLSFLFWPFLPTHCRCRGLLLHLTTLNDTNRRTHTQSVGPHCTRDCPPHCRGLSFYVIQLKFGLWLN